MLSLGDGIAIATVGGVIIAAILRIPMKTKTGCYVKKTDFDKHVEKTMTKELWKAEQGTINVKLTTICNDVNALFNQMRDLNKFLRDHFVHHENNENKRDKPHV